MLSTLTATALMASELPLADRPKEDFDTPADDRSSSLSELGDASDDHSEATPRPPSAVDLNENDSEAETERLEATPRKLTRTATDTSLASDYIYQRTPSKLAHSKTVDQEESVPPTPSVTIEGKILRDNTEGNTALQALSIAATSEAASLADSSGKKRKRSSAENSSLEEPSDEPARKRSSTAKVSGLNGSGDGMIDDSEQVDIEEELDNAEERISQLAQEEIELEERQADIAVETVSELVTVAKHTKPRKGGRRGKRKVDDTAHTNEALASIEVHEVDGDGDNEEDDSGALDEEGKYSESGNVNPLTIQSGKEEACDRRTYQDRKEV